MAPGNPPTSTQTHVEITTDGVIVECDDPKHLTVVARKALELWRATDTPARSRPEPDHVSLGFSPITELASRPLDDQATTRSGEPG